MKPSLFRNELLAVADPLHTILFAGLWCAADREGRLEDRPAKIHFDINPGRSYDGTVQSLDWLAVNGFINRYAVDGVRYIQVVNFTKHQKPHQNERSSEIPPQGSGQTGKPLATKVASTSDQGGKHFALTPSSLTPDSGLLTPRTPAGEPPAARERRPRSVDVLRPEPAWFVDLRRAYPDRAGDPKWDQAREAAEQRIREGCTPQELLDGVRRYAAYVAATGASGTQFVKAPANFLGPDKPFRLPWDLPPTKADVRLGANISAAEEFLRRTDAQG